MRDWLGAAQSRANGVTTMTKYTIELSDTLIITSRGQECAVDMGALSQTIVERLIRHGLTQKVADAASGAAKDAANADEVKAATDAMMQKAVDALYAGEWGKTRGASGVDEFTTVARQIMRQSAKAKFGAKSTEWATFTGLADDEQNTKLDAWYTKNEATLRESVEAKIKSRADERKAKAKLGAAITIDI